MPNWKKVIISGSDASLNSLNATTSLTASGLIYPDTDGDNGDFLSTDGAGNLSFTRSAVYANVKNVSGGTLQKGTPVHANGTAGNASEVIAASASVASTMPATYVLNETLANDAEGLAIITGYINGVNTSLFGEGDVIYVGESGGFTNVKPQGSDNLIQNLGVVSKVDATNGSGYVYGSGRSNDVPNLPEGKVWVGSSTYSVTSSILTLDEPNSQARIAGSLVVSTDITASGAMRLSGELQVTNKAHVTTNFLAGEDALPNSTYTLANGATSAINPGDFNSQTLQGQVLTSQQAGVSLTEGQLIVKAANNRWYPADANSTSTTYLMGIALKTVGGGSNTDVLIDGVIAMDDSYLVVSSIGEPLYSSTTTGEITNVAPTGTGDIVRIVGHYIGASFDGEYMITFKPDGTWIEL
jgi:hypothetical protein